MNTTKRFFFGLITLVAAGLPAIAPLSAAAGPIPFTQNQFPVYYAVAPQPVAVTNTSEQILFQATLPNNIIGSLGFMRLTSILDGDAIANAHTVRYYIGGVGTNSPPTGATAILTNTFTTSTATPITQYVFPFAGAFSNQVYSSTFTNFNAGATKQVVTVGTQTNTLLFTVTGSNLGTTNWTQLDAFILEALSQ